MFSRTKILKRRLLMETQALEVDAIENKNMET
jgi:hypothetical protein